MPTKRKPSYLLHKPTGQARCRIGGRDIYLGLFGSPESRAKYDEVVADWLAGQDPRRSLLSVDDLALSFFDFAEGYSAAANFHPGLLDHHNISGPAKPGLNA